MPDPSPSQDTITLTVLYSQLSAPQVMAPVTRINSSESDEELAKRALAIAADYGILYKFGKLQSVTAEWS